MEDVGMLFGIAIYVIGYCFMTGFSIFLISVILKMMKFRMPKHEAYIFLILAALPINILLWLDQSKILNLYLVVSIASLLTIYHGAKIYSKTWHTLENLNLSN